MKKQLWIIVILSFVFLASLRPPIDLDLGWHLRYGEYFFKTGHVLKENILSSVWPDYQWVQASWGYDPFVYFLFTKFGFFALSLAGALFTLIIFLLIVWPIAKRSAFDLFLLAVVFLTQTPPLYGTGMRTQTPSALFFALVLVIAMRLMSRPATSLHASRFTLHAFLSLPFLFLLWANLHGGFSLGLIVLTLIWFTYGVLLVIGKLGRRHINLPSSKTWRMFGGVLCISWIVPLINPWGTRIYEETIKHSSNLNVAEVTEWSPLPMKSVEAAVLMTVAFVTIILVGRKKRAWDIPYLVALVFLLFLAVNALRFTIQFGIMATYLFTLNVPILPKKWRIVIVSIIGVLLVYDTTKSHHYFDIPSWGLARFGWSDYCQLLEVGGETTKDCSEELAEIMAATPPQGNGYTPYNMGGFLSWRVPQIKTFVDGRMAAWQRNGQTPPLDEADQVLREKYPVMFRRFDSEYHFQWAVIPTESPLVSYLDTLVQNGTWERQYQDAYFSYYVKM